MSREIDHRVMNSLQFIAGLLSMQSRRADLSDPAEELRSASQRVAAIARVHRNFYMSEAEDKVACAPFVEGLCADLSMILGKTINAHVGECWISTEKISLIGLIVNELVTNAAKHGQGMIDVHYEIDGSDHRVRVCDEGPGVPDDFDFECADRGLGVKIMATLAAQLSGTVRVVPIDDGKRACIAVRFPA